MLMSRPSERRAARRPSALGAALALSLVAPLAFQPALPATAQPRYLTTEQLAERWGLFDALARSTSAEEARAVSNRIWSFWLRGPTPEATRRLALGIRAMRHGDFDAAETIFSDIVAETPEFSEAWNQRATLRFLRRDLEGSLADIEEVLAREPLHFGALSGKARILYGLGRTDEAEATLRAALEIHPWLVERQLLRSRDI